MIRAGGILDFMRLWIPRFNFSKPPRVLSIDSSGDCHQAPRSGASCRII